MKKAFKIAGVILVAMFLVLALSPLLFRDRIEQGVKTLANRSLKSELNFTGMSVSFFKHFPHLSLTLTGFSLKSPAPFVHDTLISAEEIAFGVNVKSLFGDTIRITRIYFDKARINIHYHENGTANYNVYQTADSANPDVAVPGDTLATPGAGLRIEHIIFNDCKVVYSDPSIPVEVVADGFSYRGTSKLSGDIFDLTSDVRIDALSVTFDQTKYIDEKPFTAKLSTKVNTRNLTVLFEKNDLQIKDIPLQFHGKFNFEKNGYQVNLNFLSVMEKEFLSARFKIRQDESLWIFARANASINLARWAKAFDLKTAGVKGIYELNLEADGYYARGPVVRGVRNQTDTVILSIPKFELMTKLSNGYLKYAGLPQALDNISFTLNASCPDHDYRNIGVQLENLRATFLKNEIGGFFRLKNLRDKTVEANLTAICNLAELKEVVPMDSLTLAGILSLELQTKGSYAPEKKKFPVSTAVISLKDGSVQTQYYPNPLEKIELLAEVTNRTGTLDDLVVHVKPLTFEFEGKPFLITADLENFEDLQYDVRSKGVIDLGKVYRVFSQEGMDLEGYIETDLSLHGKQSDAVAGRISRLNNRGTMLLRDIALRSEDFPKPFIIREGRFRFNQDKVWFDDVVAAYGVSDFRVNGSMLNTINYILSQGGTLKGKFRLQSDLINVDEFMAYAPPAGDNTTPAADTALTGVVIIPPDLDIDIEAQVKKVVFEGLEIKDLSGEIDIKKGILALSNTTLNLIGCRVNLDATYGSVTAEKGFFDFQIKAEDFDIKRAYNEVAMIREMAPSAGKTEGIVSLDYRVKGMLDATMMPVLPSLEGGGVFSVKKVKVYGLKLFNDISKGTQKEGISNPDISKVDIKSTIKNNTVILEQFKFKVKGIRVRIEGTTTFDPRINLKIRLGLGPLGIIGIPMLVTGTADNPKIKYGRGKDTGDLTETDYSDELPAEMLERIKNVKEDDTNDED